MSALRIGILGLVSLLAASAVMWLVTGAPQASALPIAAAATLGVVVASRSMNGVASAEDLKNG